MMPVMQVATPRYAATPLLQRNSSPALFSPLYTRPTSPTPIPTPPALPTTPTRVAVPVWLNWMAVIGSAVYLAEFIVRHGRRLLR